MMYSQSKSCGGLNKSDKLKFFTIRINQYTKKLLLSYNTMKANRYIYASKYNVFLKSKFFSLILCQKESKKHGM